MAKGKWYPGKHIKEVVKAASELPSEIAKGGRKVIKEVRKTGKTVKAGVKAGISGAKKQQYRNAFQEACKGKGPEHEWTWKGKKHTCKKG